MKKDFLVRTIMISLFIFFTFNGIILPVSAEALTSNLVVNGGFESPVKIGDWQDNTSAGWLMEESRDGGYPVREELEIRNQSTAILSPFEGSQYAELSPRNSGSQEEIITLSQTIPQVKGISYRISFVQSCRPDDPNPSTLAVYWGDTMLDHTSCPSDHATTWIMRSYTVTATSNDPVQLKFVNEGSGNSFGTLLDDVSVKAINNNSIPAPEFNSTPFLYFSLFVVVVYYAGSRLRYYTRKPEKKSASEVYFSVISPKTIIPESSFLIDIWAHLEDQRNEVIRRYKEGSINDDIFIKTIGPAWIKIGTDLVIHLDLPGLIVENSEQHILWTGTISSSNFLITVPKKIIYGKKIGTIKIYAGSLMILKFFFEINVGDKMTKKEPIHIDLHRITKAFVSYASIDREKVLSRIQGIQKIAPNLEFRMDIKDIRSGQKWKQALREFIETSDIFYLFWSKNAKDSTWVEKEWRCALKLKGIDFIDPVPLESPEDVPPPVELAEKHFNDWILAYSRMKI